MKTTTLTQTQKPHDVNRLHDAFIAAGVVPTHVESSSSESRFVFENTVSDSNIANVIAAYTFAAPAPPLDVAAAWQAYKTAVTNATNVTQIKSALTNELGTLLKELFKSRNSTLS